MSRLKAEIALPTASGTRRAFTRASSSFDDARFVHDETRRRLLERLAYMRISPRHVLDLGCATAAGSVQLAGLYPDARVVAVDATAAMLRQAQRRCASVANAAVLGADAERLPVRDHSVELLFANLLLPWCDPAAAFREAARVLAKGGLIAFATLGPDTLGELRSAWARVDDAVHVHAFTDMHDLGDLALGSGLAEPVMDVDRLEVTYAGLDTLVADLRACGGVNLAPGRRRSMTGPGRWQRFERELRGRQPGGRFAITVELVFGHAWGTGVVRGPGGESAFPADRIPIRSRQALPH